MYFVDIIYIVIVLLAVLRDACRDDYPVVSSSVADVGSRHIALVYTMQYTDALSIIIFVYAQ